jgi:uncharacterized protein (DUF2267 family)
MNNPTYDRWFATLPAAQQARANELVSMLRALNADDPESWAQSEISEDIPQLARFLVLRRIWPEYIDSWTREPDRWIMRSVDGAGHNPQGHFADAGAALRRMTERGVSPADIASVARMVAYETAFAVLDHIDEGHDPDLCDGSVRARRSARVVARPRCVAIDHRCRHAARRHDTELHGLTPRPPLLDPGDAANLFGEEVDQQPDPGNAGALRDNQHA